jgi:hypothetical protein
LKPGGWIECQTLDYVPQSDRHIIQGTDLAIFWEHVSQGFDGMGLDLCAASKLPDLIRDVGFWNISEEHFRIPVGSWQEGLEEVGKDWRDIMIESSESMALRPLTKGLGWTVDQVKTLLETVETAYIDDLHVYMRLFVIYGQKP